MTTRVRDDVGSYDDIAAAAVRTTGLSDFGGTDHEEGLRILVDDLNAPAAGLTGEGNYMQRSMVKSALVGRLLSQLGFTQNPSYAEVPVERPVFVVGLPRTGTTALHRLLAADPRHQGLELWLTEFPQPRPPRATWADNPVFNGINAAYAEHHVENPEFMGIHYMDAASVEECWRLLRQAGMSIGYESLAHVRTYSSWLAKQDWTPAYERHKANLQLIGLNDPDRRWVLKNPSHLVALDAIMAVYPDALIVQTHRDPVVSIASSCSLSAEATAGWSTTFVGDTIGRTQLEMLSRSWHTFASARTSYDPAQFIDVEYADFVADPVATTRRIYEGFDLGWTPSVAAAVEAIDAESRQGGKRPSHRYSLDDYGLTEEQVRAAF
ncbi:sulfotransferase family protein [Nocardioides sp. Root140]|uniref:sulfotransferase family protein n=1 Tax=Nocardioides sp. Root140 TaxID=1736460 RepID=UPI0006FC4B63|nr:sulfotransferase [Nocardioides sp. Root140]KQY57080.1 sulfotransferase [Nocardioides sp. Root140]